MIPRLLEESVLNALRTTEKIIIIFGARQVGKTTLLNGLRQKLKKLDKKTLYLNCDLDEDKSAINTTSFVALRRLIGNTDYVFIDEAQRLDDPGLTLKIIYDHIKNVHVVATGSSSFELKNRLSDALTGRYLDFNLYPLSFIEALSTLDGSDNQVMRKNQADSILADVLLYGLYPEVFGHLNTTEAKTSHLKRLIDSYLFRDILAFQKIRHPQAIKDLTRAIAYQIGSETNETELAGRIKIDRKTVVNYLEILEKAFVIVRLFPYSRNPRREIGRRYKIYFADTGIRNALIGDYNSIEVRSDLGALWENFLIIERLKHYANQGRLPEYHFWRTYGGAEVDFLERLPSENKTRAFEFRYARERLSKGARIFSQKYNIAVKVINKDNYLEFGQGEYHEVV